MKSQIGADANSGAPDENEPGFEQKLASKLAPNNVHDGAAGLAELQAVAKRALSPAHVLADDTPPAAETAPPAPSPPEGWETFASDTAVGETLIRWPLEGGGYFETSLETLARLEAEHAQRLAQPAVLHQVELVRQRRERESAAELERKARNPFAVLRQAHQLVREGQVEVDRLAPLVQRAGAMVHELEDRAAAQFSAVWTCLSLVERHWVIRQLVFRTDPGL